METDSDQVLVSPVRKSQGKGPATLARGIPEGLLEVVTFDTQDLQEEGQSAWNLGGR